MKLVKVNARGRLIPAICSLIILLGVLLLFSFSHAHEVYAEETQETETEEQTIGTGLYKVDGEYRYYENGKFTKAIGLVRDANKNWFYVYKGKVNRNATGLVKCVQPGDSYGKWYYVYKGKLNRNATGLVKCIQPGDENKGKWFYVKKGKLNKSTTGLVKCIQPGDENKGKWFYVYKGSKTKKATGMVKCVQPESSAEGKWYYVYKGSQTKKATGLVKNIQPKDENKGKYFSVEKGKFKSKTGIVKNIQPKDENNGQYFYVKKGTLDNTFRGTYADSKSWIVEEGKAKLVSTTEDWTYYRAMKIVESITNDSMTKEEKLKACFDHIKNGYPEYNPRIPHYNGNNWWTLYANDIFVGANGRKGGNCMSVGASLAYLAKAVGYEEVYAINTGGHGWAEINGLIYDAEWARHKRDKSYYAMTYNGTGKEYRYVFSLSNQYARVKI